MQMKFSKIELIETLKKNLGRHQKVVEEAVEGYRQKAIAALRERLEAFERGDMGEGMKFSLYPPDEHVSDYRRAIAMLTASVDGEVTLSVEEYRKYVEDNWEWKSTFLFQNSHLRPVSW